MNTLFQNLSAIAQSPHTSIPGAIVLICSLGEIWFPQYTDQFHKTREFAISYGLIMGAQIKRRPADSDPAAPPLEAPQPPETPPTKP